MNIVPETPECVRYSEIEHKYYFWHSKYPNHIQFLEWNSKHINQVQSTTSDPEIQNTIKKAREKLQWLSPVPQPKLSSQQAILPQATAPLPSARLATGKQKHAHTPPHHAPTPRFSHSVPWEHLTCKDFEENPERSRSDLHVLLN
ncbi:hypothetical protein COCC4DRAFT_25194 [Bipolaris maydis ATCC 48331]|uniref:Uncharacterized protein n=2 Tax=Cochliobolus heterostrophus TaxID=5016 RepID=M2UF72_COCH5|nr:uncharacterized protein COCC4DRAFT_25194 [Bipolaris maydis ATCC 48331]EMD86547.1 hypothetical protein COCHEDRAFT_1034360 [Bipolaris maydis C5]KAJ5051202.1 hypothetical protein J3E74DRAFT_295865 [Bipolaris maydis]ENI02970.1 hypothetical protein COCC4DRAFT_25194 [Bipolaris maydis ATCC 48331]KAJ5051209.1 hypothetical protein J3E74DRAFT_295868 [Bipolaris maydis]KAJ6203846.1 hypothetical protein PSV09DRAFT_1034360 [Bipolaris maydis]